MPSLATKTRAKGYELSASPPPYLRRKFKFVPRTDELIGLEGYYDGQVENVLFVEHQAYLESGGRLAFSRWLVKSKGVQDPSAICKEVSEGSRRFKLTCRFNDILRMSETNSYDACTQPGRIGEGAVRVACRNKNFAMLVIVGPSGHFIGRIGFTLKDNKVQLFRAYGVMSIQLAKNFFAKLNYEVKERLCDLVIDISSLID